MASNTALIQEITDKVLEQIDLGNITPIVLIDGRSNSGKSTFAKSLQESLFKQGESLPRVIHMDDLYPGWEGLSLGADYLNRFILEPLTKNKLHLGNSGIGRKTSAVRGWNFLGEPH